jgi:hypothetical protein
VNEGSLCDNVPVFAGGSLGLKIGVLQHEFSPFERPGLLAYLCDAWLADGHRVEMLHGIPAEPVELDVLIPHVDLTVTPQEYQDFIERYPVVVNRLMTDNSKRKVSQDILTAEDPWPGEVIVKTDRNFGGIPERVIQNVSEGQPLEREIPQRPWRKVDQILPARYPVFPSLRDVPSGVWRNPELIVEKFLPEIEGDLYCNRVAIVMGDKVLCRRVYARAKVIKGVKIEKTEEVDPPAELAAIRERIGMDYGKIDFVVHEDGVHVFDMNNTPSGLNDPEVDAGIGQKLAPGLEAVVEAAGVVQ